MSDTSQGPGWWQASDGKWYPPEQQPGYQAPGGGAPAGGAGGTDLGATLTYAWNKFIQNIGEWIAIWGITVGFFILWFFLVIVIAFSSSGFGGGFGLRFNFLGIIMWLIGGAVYGVIHVITAKAAVQAVNGQKVDLGAAMKLSTNNIIAGAIFGAAWGLLYSFCWIFALAAYAFLGFVPVLSALDDKGADALSESINLTTSRANEALVYWLVAGLISGLVCGLGAPIAMIGGVYLIKQWRGEAVAA